MSTLHNQGASVKMSLLALMENNVLLSLHMAKRSDFDMFIMTKNKITNRATWFPAEKSANLSFPTTPNQQYKTHIEGCSRG